MAQKIEWTKPAINDFRNIIEYYFPFSEEYVNPLYFKIIHNVNYIADNPLLRNATS
jgi:plasmid stabilization system protein ParE